MIRYTKGDIFDAQTDAIVNTVNTVGIMGKGIALQFKQRFPENYTIYKAACDEQKLNIGELLITPHHSLFFKYIINFPTKKDWKHPSKYEYIEQGLATLVEKIKEFDIKSIALPPLGAGNGKLDWEKVKPIIERYLAPLSDVSVVVYEPQEVFQERDNIKAVRASLTPVRALLLHVFYQYQKADTNLNLLVIQKLAYFLQRFGEPLRLQYTKGWYGPYASNLNKVLQAINGTYIKYQAQNDSPINAVELFESKKTEIENQLQTISEAQHQRLNTLLSFIDGFQTPFSLEILATVDWILQENPEFSQEEVYHQIGNWTKRKAELIKPYHVAVAYQQLVDFGLQK